MINAVELQNWKTHLNSRFEFGKGTNVLVGAMGSGKTSVMDAICFALFGTFPALQQRRVSLQEIIMSKPVKMEQAKVKLEFEYAGKKLEVERTVKERGSSEAKLYIDGKFVSGPKPKDVNTAIENCIEINYNLFSRAVYSEQNQIDFFLRLSPGQRKEKFDELLELDRYEKVRVGAVSALNRLEGMARDKGEWLRELKEQGKKSGLVEAEKKLAEKKARAEELENGMKELEKKVGLLRKEVGEQEEKEKKFNSLKEEASNKEFSTVRIAKEVEEGEKELNGLDSEIIEKSLAGKENESRELEKGARELEEMEKKLIEEKAGLKQEMRANEIKAKEIEEQTDGIEKVGSNCPVCKTELSKEKKEAIKAENKGESEKVLEKNRALTERIKIIEKKRDEAALKKAGKKKEAEAIAENVLKLSRLLDTARKLGEKKKQAKTFCKEAEKARREINELGFDDKKANGTKDLLIRSEATVDSNKREQKDLDEIIAVIKREIETIRKQVEQIKEMEENIEAISKGCEKLALFTNSLSETQAQLRESLIETINEAMDSIWQKLYPYKDYLSAKMAVEKGNYELVVKNSAGEWIRVEGILSGGERSSAAICIRIAFSLVLTRNLSWIILDEPTHNLDSVAVNNLSEMMRENLPELIDQIFVITHDKEMEKAASGSLYVLRRNKETDQPTKAELVKQEN